MQDEAPARMTIVIDPDTVSRCIRDPARNSSTITALMDICGADSIEIAGCEEWMAYLSQLMVSVRYYYLLKDYRLTRRLATRETPVLTLYFIERLYNATMVRPVQGLAKDASLRTRQITLAQGLPCDFVGLKAPENATVAWTSLESLVADPNPRCGE